MNAICLILWAGIRTWHDVANLAILLWNKKILLLCWGMLRSSSLLQCATNKHGAVTVTWYSGQASNSTQHDTGHLFQAHTGLVTKNGKASSWTTMMTYDEDSRTILNKTPQVGWCEMLAHLFIWLLFLSVWVWAEPFRILSRRVVV